MANGLLDYLSGFGSTPPEYLGGLLGQDAVDKLKGRAATTGIANAVLGYLAAPKNQNLGLGRIIGQSLQAGMTGAQGVYDTATQDYLAAQKVADMQRKQARDVKVQEMIGGIADPRERLAAELAPEQYIAATFKPAKDRETTIAPNGQLIYKDTGELVTQTSFAAPKEPPSMTDEPSRVAYALFRKPLNQLSPEEVGSVNQYIEQSRVRVAGAGVPSQSPTFKDAGELRKEYQALPTVKAFNEVNTAYNQIKGSLSNPSPANDLAAATKFMKLLDPNSVVRESELMMAMNATGLFDRVQNYANYVISGQKLNASQRKDFADASAKLYEAALQSKNAVENQYVDISKEGGLNPKLVVGSPTSNAALTNQELARKILEQRRGKK
jgi:hypothetical protein